MTPVRRLSPRKLTAAAALALLALAPGCGGSSATTQGVAASPAKPAAPAFVPLSVPAGAPVRSVRVPILTYHRVHRYETELAKSVPDLTVEPDVFAAEIAALKRAGYHSISQRQLFAALYRGATLPPKPVLISVDDGYTDDVTEILPVLRRAHMVATFYVITGRFQEGGFLNEGQVRQLEAAGMDIGAHTRHHLPLPALGPATLESEVAGSRQDLERVLGHPVYWFAYPFGSFSPAVVQAVHRAGFLLAVTTASGTRQSTLAPLTLPRLHVGRGATPESVLGFAGGGGSAVAPAATG